MRFLLFNLVVSLALVYLLLGEHRATVIDGLVGQALDRSVAASDTAEQMIDPGKAIDGSAELAIAQPVQSETSEGDATSEYSEPISLTSQTLPRIETEPENTQVASSSPTSVIERYPLEELPLELIPIPSTSLWSGEQTLLSVDDPAVERRRAEVLGMTVAEDEVPPTFDPTFMSPSERQRELHALAEEMELLFADKLIQ